MIAPLADEYQMKSIKVFCQTVFKEILGSGNCTVKNQVDIFVLAEKYQWLDEVLPVVSELLCQNNLSDLRLLDGYDVIKKNGVVLEKRLSMIERGRNYKHLCFFKQRQNAWTVFSEKILYKLQYSKSVWMADEYRCMKQHWSLADFHKSPAAGCKNCLISIQDGIQKCFAGMCSEMLIILKDDDVKTGELKQIVPG